MKTLYTLSVLLKNTSENSLNLAWKMLKGDTIRLQTWFIIRRVSWLDTVAYTSGCHKDYKGDWLHRGLLHSFWRREILVWNRVYQSRRPVGMWSPWLPGTYSKVHWQCKMEFPSFSRWIQVGLFLSSFRCNKSKYHRKKGTTWDLVWSLPGVKWGWEIVWRGYVLIYSRLWTWP